MCVYLFAPGLRRGCAARPPVDFPRRFSCWGPGAVAINRNVSMSATDAAPATLAPLGAGCSEPSARGSGWVSEPKCSGLRRGSAKSRPLAQRGDGTALPIARRPAFPEPELPPVPRSRSGSSPRGFPSFYYFFFPIFFVFNLHSICFTVRKLKSKWG